MDRFVELKPSSTRLTSLLGEASASKDDTSTVLYAFAVAGPELTAVPVGAGAVEYTIVFSDHPPEVARTEKPAVNALVVYTFNCADVTAAPPKPDNGNRR
jgi:hypothetical protein